jgi:hypothetical protein
VNLNEDHELIRQLQSAVPPWPAGDDPSADLWPRMLRRLDQAPPRWGWFEAALLAAIALVFTVFPEAVPLLLWHL